MVGGGLNSAGGGIITRVTLYVAVLAQGATMPISLASHTLQSQEKEGLVTMRIASCSVGMQ